MKIAVTGAAGTIGARLCADLAADHSVVRIDLHDADVVADVRDLPALEAAFAGCDAVVHLAGVVAVEAEWDAVYGANILGTYNAFEAARRAGCTRFVFASSNHAVGGYEVELAPQLYELGFGLVLHAEAALRPDSLYGVWKAFGRRSGAITATSSACRSRAFASARSPVTTTRVIPASRSPPAG